MNPITMKDASYHAIIKYTLYVVYTLEREESRLMEGKQIDVNHIEFHSKTKSMISKTRNYLMNIPVSLIDEYVEMVIKCFCNDIVYDNIYSLPMKYYIQYAILLDIIPLYGLSKFNDEWFIDEKLNGKCLKMLFKKLAQCSRLKKLSLHEYELRPQAYEYYSEMFKNFTHLTSLKIMPTRFPYRYSPYALVLKPVTQYCHELRELHLVYNGDLEWLKIEDLVKYRKLVSLWLYDIGSTAPEDVVDGLQKLLIELKDLKCLFHKYLKYAILDPNKRISGTLGLEHLILRDDVLLNEVELTTDELFRLSKICPATQTLKLIKPPPCINSVARAFPNMKTLDLGRCRDVILPSLSRALLHKNLMNLKVLKLREVFNMNYTHISQLAHHCPHLEVLDISFATILADGDLTLPPGQSSAFPKLKELTMVRPKHPPLSLKVQAKIMETLENSTNTTTLTSITLHIMVERTLDAVSEIWNVENRFMDKKNPIQLNYSQFHRNTKLMISEARNHLISIPVPLIDEYVKLVLEKFTSDLTDFCYLLDRHIVQYAILLNIIPFYGLSTFCDKWIVARLIRYKCMGLLLKKLVECSKLEKLSLSEIPESDIEIDSFYDMFKNLTRLKSLRIVPIQLEQNENFSFNKIIESGVEDDLPFNFVIKLVTQHCLKLRELHLAYDGEGLRNTGSKIEDLVKCHNLVSLWLYDQSSTTAVENVDGLQKLLIELKNLKCLHHKNLKSAILDPNEKISGTLRLEHLFLRDDVFHDQDVVLTTDELVRLSKICPATRTLKLIKPPPCINSVARAFPNLEILEMSRYSNFILPSLSCALIQNNLKNLKVLKLENFLNINYTHISQLAHHCPNLEVLDISYSTIKADGDLILPPQQSSAFPHLIKLRMTPKCILNNYYHSCSAGGCDYRTWEVEEALTRYLLEGSYKLKSLHIHYKNSYYKPSTLFILKMLKSLKCLTSLQLVSFLEMNCGIIRKMVSRCPRLNELAAFRSWNFDIRDHGLPTQIDLKEHCECINTDFIPWKFLLQYAILLELIPLSELRTFNDQWVSHVALRHDSLALLYNKLAQCSKLKKLSLHKHPLDDYPPDKRMITNISKMIQNNTHLTYLELMPDKISDYIFFTCEFVIGVVPQYCHELRELHLMYDGDRLKKTELKIEDLVQCRKLVSLWLYDNSFTLLEDVVDGLQTLLIELKDLKCLFHKYLKYAILNPNNRISGTLGLEHLILRDDVLLRREDEVELTTDELLRLCKICPATRTLKLIKPPPCIDSVASALPNLETLDLGRCRDVILPSLSIALRHKNLMNLKVLKLREVFNMNYTHISQLAHHCPHLEVLDISFATILADGDLTLPPRRSSAFPKLKELTMVPKCNNRFNYTENEIGYRALIWEVGEDLTRYLLKGSHDLESLHIHYNDSYYRPSYSFILEMLESLKCLTSFDLVSSLDMHIGFIREMVTRCPLLIELGVFRYKKVETFAHDILPLQIKLKYHCKCSDILHKFFWRDYSIE
uniref:Uncharacterized protein n=1 Tax=Melicertus latisulcatus majanivirus TaxID=2984277 RepID=A0A9C7EYH6_9VIRU|nr:MAG: hypothetical protein [Melicertus latisulcatus majanivirus]